MPFIRENKTDSATQLPTKNTSENVTNLSVLEVIRTLAQIINGRGAILDSLAKKGTRLNLVPPTAKQVVKPVLLLTNPSDVKSVWVDNSDKLNKRGHAYDALRTVFGRGLIPIETSPEWKAHQMVLAKHMQPKHIPELEGHLYSYLEEMMSTQNPQNKDEFVIPNVNEALIRANFQLTAQSFFGRNATQGEAVLVSQHIHTVNQFLLANALMMGFPHLLYKNLPSILQNVKIAEAAFKTYAEEIVNAETPLTGYMKALSDAGPSGTGQMTAEAQRDEVILAIISSYVSTATATGWALAFLSQPEFSHYQEIVRAEMQDRTIAQQDSVTSMIIKEGLRLYPPVFVMTRKVTDDIAIDNQNGKLEISEGSSVFISPYITQRNPNYWSKPNTFQPQRFENEIHDHAYLPFGLGQRQCIGTHYTMRVSALSLGHILSKYEIQMITPPHPMFRATLHPSHDFAIRAKKLI